MASRLCSHASLFSLHHLKKESLPNLYTLHGISFKRRKYTFPSQEGGSDFNSTEG